MINILSNDLDLNDDYYQMSFEEIFEIPSLGMILSGIYPKKANKWFWKFYSDMLVVVLTFINYLFVNVCYVDISKGDFPNLAIQLSLFIPVEVSYLKIVYFKFVEDKLEQMLRKIEGTYKASKYHPKEHQKLLIEGINKGRSGSTLWFILVIMNTTSIWMHSIVEMIYKNLKSNFREKVMMHEIILPFINNYRYWSPFYEVFYILSLSVLGVAMANFTAVDGFFIIAVTHNEAQMKILKLKIQRLYSDLVFSDLNLVKSRVTNIVSHHLEIISFHDKSQNLMSPVFANMLFLTSLQLCVVGYQISDGLDHKTLKMDSLVMLVATLVQAYVPCSYGSAISDMSESIAEAAYFSDWHTNQDSSINRNLRILITRAQAPLVFSGVGMVPLTIETFASLINTAFSLFNVVRNSG